MGEYSSENSVRTELQPFLRWWAIPNQQSLGFKLSCKLFARMHRPMQRSDDASGGDIFSQSSTDTEFGEVDVEAGVRSPSCIMDDSDGGLSPADGGLSPADDHGGILSMSEDGGATRSAGPSEWVAGQNVGSYVKVWRRGRVACMSESGRLAPGEQVLITNVVENLLGLPSKALRCVSDALSVVRSQGFSLAASVAGRLLGISGRHVKRVYDGMRQRSFVPAMPGRDNGASIFTEDADDNQPAACPQVDFVQCNTVRMILALSVDGNSHLRIADSLHRMLLAGAQVCVPQDPVYSSLVISIASMALQHLDADDFNGDLPGIGIPSDFGVLADGVTMGLGVRSRHDTLLVVCLCLASKWTGRLYTPMHSAPAMPIGSHGGPAMASMLVTCMASHPACWDVGVMRARCSAISGDGQLCEGGTEHRHNSSAAAEKLWKIMFPNASGQPDGGLSPPLCTVWDPFHRVDIATWRAVRAVPLAVKVFDMSRQLDCLFGQSEGVLFWRHLRGPESRSLRAPGGTRKVGPISIPPSSQLQSIASTFSVSPCSLSLSPLS